MWDVDWRRLLRRCILVATPALAIPMLVMYAVGGQTAVDFHWGVWTAARDLLHGSSPYPPADPQDLRKRVGVPRAVANRSLAAPTSVAS